MLFQSYLPNKKDGRMTQLFHHSFSVKIISEDKLEQYSESTLNVLATTLKSNATEIIQFIERHPEDVCYLIIIYVLFIINNWITFLILISTFLTKVFEYLIQFHK
jgi:hypothetical protein